VSYNSSVDQYKGRFALLVSGKAVRSFFRAVAQLASPVDIFSVLLPLCKSITEPEDVSGKVD